MNQVEAVNDLALLNIRLYAPPLLMKSIHRIKK